MFSPRQLSFLFFFPLLFSMVISPVGAAFTNPPTFDLTTSNNVAGATDAVYTFHFENPDPAEIAISFSVVVPAGYFVNPSYMTTTPGIVVMAGYYDIVGDYSAPYLGTVEIKTTTTSGIFEIFRNGLSEGSLVLILPTPTTPGSFGGILPSLNDGFWGEVSTAAGFLINPSTPGLYTWGPNTATPTSGPTVPMNPRGGKTNQVTIISTYVLLDVPYVDVPVGSTFTIPVSIRNLPRSMNKFDLSVTWDPNLAELTGIVENGEQESRPWDTYYTNPPWSGSVTCYGEGQPWSQDAVWFTLTFRCKNVGTSIISAESGAVSSDTIYLVEPSQELTSNPFAIYCNQRQPTPLSNPVGGVVLPTSKLDVVAPFAALAGLVAAVSAVVVVKKRR